METDAAQKLWHWREQPADLTRGFATFDDHGKDLQRRDQSVARGREIGQDDVAGLFAADIQSDLTHALRDVAVAHLGTVQRKPSAGEVAFKSQVRHDGRNHCVAGQSSRGCPG